MEEVVSALSTGLKGTAFEPGYVGLVIGIVIILWFLTRKK